MLHLPLILVATLVLLYCVHPKFVRGTLDGSASVAPSAYDATIMKGHARVKRTQRHDGRKTMPAHLLSDRVISISDSVKELLQTTRDIYSEMRTFEAQVTDRMDKMEAMLTNSSIPEQIEGLRQEGGSISTSIEKLKETADDVLDKLETSLLAAQKMKEGYNWTRTPDQAIQQVSRYKVSWFVSRDKVKYMMTRIPPVVSSRNFEIAGYVMRLTLVVKPSIVNLWYGLYFSICPGPNDAMLEWPFRTQFTLVVNHPVLRRKSRRSPPDSFFTGSLTPFDRPVKKCNIERGHPALLSVNDAEKEGFFMNDYLHLSFELHPAG